MIAKKSTKTRPEGNMKSKDNELVITKEVIRTLRCVIRVVCVTRWEGGGSSIQHN